VASRVSDLILDRTSMDRAPDLIIIGPPGSGKSTLAGRLAEQLGFAHLNPGTLLRQIAAEDSATGEQVRDLMANGALVPDEVTDELVRQRLMAIPPDQGVILDGYPRNAAQAEALHRVLAESGRLRPRPLVLRLDAPRGGLLNRLRRRRDIEGRDDDTDDMVRRRLQIYDAEPARVVDALADWADVVAIDGDQPVEAVKTEALEKLEARRICTSERVERR
jgi:adenylate kinase